MNVAAFATLYVLVGAGCAVAILVRGGGAGSLRDAALLLAVWPLYGPFLLAGDRCPAPSSPRRMAFLDALDRAQGAPLALLLPDRETAQRLVARSRDAEARIAEIDALLGGPEFSEDSARERSALLEARGDRRAASMASSRADNIRRLRHLRERLRREVDEATELQSQLRVQAEIVRMAGSDRIEGESLLSELEASLATRRAVVARGPQLQLAYETFFDPPDDQLCHVVNDVSRRR
ncbi:MAG: hypothetical protein U0166_20705 [Acidobacteriota bacterium]